MRSEEAVSVFHNAARVSSFLNRISVMLCPAHSVGVDSIFREVY
jgi:hypothetical protein